MDDSVDFDIQKNFEDESFSSLGFINEIVHDGIFTTFKTSKMNIKLTTFDGVGIKVDVNLGTSSSTLTVPHKDPDGSKKTGYRVRFPARGERFSFTVLKGDEGILSPFSMGDQSKLLNLSDEFYENVSVSTKKEMMRISFRIPTNYGIYGLGENFTTFNKRGKTLYTFPYDNYYLRAKWVYKGIPFFISNAGLGVVFPEYIPMKFDFGETIEGLITITIPAKSFSFYILYGTPIEILQEFFYMFGEPELPPEWSFGMWVSRWAGIGYKSTKDVSDILSKFKEKRIPFDVISMDPQWLQDYVPGVTFACEFRWDRSSFKSDDELGNFLKANGKKLCLWINPYVILNGRTAKEMEKCLLRDTNGKIALVPNQDRKPNEPKRGMVDFTKAECFKRYSKLVEDLMIRSNADAVMTDFGETVPIDSVDVNGNPGYLIRNLIGDLYQKSAFNGVKSATGKGMIWGRSGSMLTHNYPTQWSGDSGSTWEGMRTVLRAALSASMSGTIFTAFDTGGFAGKPDRLLYIRWVAMGALFSNFKLHGTTPREPWYYDDEIVDAFRSLVRLRYSLIPYIISEARLSLKNRKPMIRPLVLEFPNDPESQFIDDEYLLGDKILVAPIFNEIGKRSVYVPPGRWIGFYDRKEIFGPKWIDVEEPISKIPLFVKGGSIIEMADGDVENVDEALRIKRKKIDF